MSSSSFSSAVVDNIPYGPYQLDVVAKLSKNDKVEHHHNRLNAYLDMTQSLAVQQLASWGHPATSARAYDVYEVQGNVANEVIDASLGLLATSAVHMLVYSGNICYPLADVATGAAIPEQHARWAMKQAIGQTMGTGHKNFRSIMTEELGPADASLPQLQFGAQEVLRIGGGEGRPWMLIQPFRFSCPYASDGSEAACGRWSAAEKALVKALAHNLAYRTLKSRATLADQRIEAWQRAADGPRSVAFKLFVL